MAWSGNVLLRPGKWYRATFGLASPTAVAGSGTHRVGIGWHAAGAPSNTTVLLRSVSLSYHTFNAPQNAQVPYVFRHPADAAAVEREFEGRMWSVGAGTFRYQSLMGQGDGITLSVEDMG